METFQSQLTRKLSEALSSAGFPLAGEVSPATDPRFGDYQSNAALILGKQLGENPRTIAQRLCDRWVPGELDDASAIAGPGFLNFSLKPEAIAIRAAELLEDE